MKKLYLLLLTVFSLAAASAQVQFGVKAGANFSTFTGDNTDDAKTKVGFNAGALVALPLFNEFSLQPEVVYSGQGFKVSDQGISGTFNANYLNVPVLFKYNNPTGFFLQTGPQIGFLMSAKVKSGGQTEDEKDLFNSTDFSWAFGLGYLVKSVNVGIDARYNLGLSNIAKDSGDEKVKNSVFQVGLFYLFGGGGSN
ncbi:MAG TPA: porin family protein [Puia sp.]|nr:porin family protein [Puia sp.]